MSSLAKLDPSIFTVREHFCGFQAIATFPNSYGVSVVPEANGQSYEVAILRNGKLCYDSGLTEDVFRYLTEDSVRDVAAVTASLPAPN